MSKEKFTAALMLSGGKDSCALAVIMKEAGINFLAVTIDHDMLSDIARENILKITRALDIESITYRPNPALYKREFIDKGWNMVTTCGACSMASTKFVQMICDWMGINIIYAGFTKYTAIAQGWPIAVNKELDGFKLVYPFMQDYDLSEIREICSRYNLILDPTQTNCKYIKELIDRDTDNPFTRELDLLFKDGQVSQVEYDYYRAFTEPARETRAGQDRGSRVHRKSDLQPESVGSVPGAEGAR